MLSSREEKFFNQDKSRRIQYLGDLGFNIPVLQCILNDFGKLAKFYLEHRDTGAKFSFRTQLPSEYKEKGLLAPHFPNVKIDAFLYDKLYSAMEKGFDLLVYDAIDPEYALRKGSFWVDKQNDKFILEYAEGPGTVRDLVRDRIISVNCKLTEWLRRQEDINYLFLGHPPLKYYNIPFSSFIIEFSIYSIPIGNKKKQEIFWEIREGT